MRRFLCFLIVAGIAMMTYLFIALAWVGAEYIFEGTVHAGQVDAVICGIISIAVARQIWNGIQKR